MDNSSNELTQRSGAYNLLDDSNSLPRTSEKSQSVYVTACSTHMDTVIFMHKWRINQFSVQQELSNAGDFLESNSFGSSNGEYKFRLKLFPSGKDEECRGYLSLFLQINKCPSPKLRFRVNFYIDATDGPRGCALNKNVVTINRGGIVTASKFFSTETLKNRLGRFLPDDVLTVGVELTVYGDQSSHEVEPEDEALVNSEGVALTPRFSLGFGDEGGSSSRSSVIGHDLGQLLDNPDFADFTLVVGRRSFSCHKAILSVRSAFFQAMFRNEDNQENKSGQATLQDVTPEVISSVLEFIYTENCSDLLNHPLEILAAADRFCLERLKLQCQDVLIRDITPKNICERLRAADLYGAAKLRKKALSVFQRNKQQILESREWNDLEKDCPALAASVLKSLIINTPDTIRPTSTTPVQDSILAKRPRIT